MTYVYHVAYAHSRGFGSIEMFSPEPYTRTEQINEAREQAAIGGPFAVSEVVVLGWQLLRTEPEVATS